MDGICGFSSPVQLLGVLPVLVECAAIGGLHFGGVTPVVCACVCVHCY